MRNLGITDGICRILRESKEPMKPCHVARKLPLPDGWSYEKLRRNVAAIMIHELRLGNRGRWIRTEFARYKATEVKTWVKTGILIQHQKTGAILRVKGKLKRNGHATTLHRWEVFNPVSNLTWGLRGEDIENDWKKVGEEELNFVYKKKLAS
jgi:hypothetical protein